MRIDLGNGQWAELRERLTYGQAQPLRAAFLRVKEGDADARSDIPRELFAAYVSAWHVLDFDGQAVSLDTPELAPDSVLIDVAAATVDLWNEQAKPVPKAGTKRSRSTRPALRSA